MLSSHACQIKIMKYTNLKSKLVSLKTSCYECISSLYIGNKYFFKIIISGKPVGREDLNSISVDLRKIDGYLDEIIKECDEKILEYEELKKQAEERERAVLPPPSNNNLSSSHGKDGVSVTGRTLTTGFTDNTMR